MSGFPKPTIIPHGSWRPSDNNMVAANFDPALISGGIALSAGAIVYDMRMPIVGGSTITNLLVYLTSAGATLTAGSCPFQLLDANGNLLGACADQANAWQTAGLCVAPIIGGPVTFAADTVANVVWRVAGTTLPAFASGNTGNTVANINIPQPGPARAGYGINTNPGIPNPFGSSSLNAYFQFWVGAS